MALSYPPINEATQEKTGLFRHPWTRWFLSIYNNAAGYVESALFFGYHAAGGLTVNTTGVDLTITDEVKKDDEFTHATSSAEITVLKDGYYQINVDCGFEVDEYDNVELAIYLDSGSGYAVMDGGKSYT
jgi:hypothetical protein